MDDASLFRHAMITRRRFLATSSTAVAGLGLSPHALSAIPLTRATRRTRPNDWIPDLPTDETFRALALAAMDAARAAGAEFADIRIGVQRAIGVPVMPYSPSARWQFGYGVRSSTRNVELCVRQRYVARRRGGHGAWRGGRSKTVRGDQRDSRTRGARYAFYGAGANATRDWRLARAL